jgi:hypothetical protein
MPLTTCGVSYLVIRSVGCCCLVVGGCCCLLPEQVRSDVAALALEEVAPLAVSDATLRTPAEVYAAQAGGEQKAEQELTRFDMALITGFGMQLPGVDGASSACCHRHEMLARVEILNHLGPCSLSKLCRVCQKMS